MLFLEGGLDALAPAQLEDRQDTIYLSTGGGFGPHTEATLIRLADGKKVLSGFDNDEADAILDSKLRALLPDTERMAPPGQIEGTNTVCKDWLNVLNATRSAPAPSPEPARAAPVSAPAMQIDVADEQLTTPETDAQEPVSKEPQDEDDGPDFI